MSSLPALSSPRDKGARMSHRPLRQVELPPRAFELAKFLLGALLVSESQLSGPKRLNAVPGAALVRLRFVGWPARILGLRELGEASGVVLLQGSFIALEPAVYVSILTSEDLEALHTAIEEALMEAAERDMELSLADIAVRLFGAYAMGERDPEKLADAVVFNTQNRYLN